MNTHLDSRPALPAFNPDHHMWNNNGTWWCHFTVHRDDYTAERVRVSLRTRNRQVARRRRDLLIAAVPRIAMRLPHTPSRHAPVGATLPFMDPRTISPA
jgi:hypothetical protein